MRRRRPGRRRPPRLVAVGPEPPCGRAGDRVAIEPTDEAGSVDSAATSDRLREAGERVVVGNGAHVGVVRRDKPVDEAVTEPTLAATLGAVRRRASGFPTSSAGTAARGSHHLDVENPVRAVGATARGEAVETATYGGPGPGSPRT